MSEVGDRPGPAPPGSSRAHLLELVTAALVDVPPGARVVVALSGGPDSTAMAYLIAEARPDLGPVLVHVRHGLRDDAEDQRVVATHASWLGAELRVVDVAVRPAGEGVAAAARRVRYEALRRVADEEGAAVVLVGHTAEDQAETLLLRLARGTGVDGLAAMRPRSGDLLRPLLRLRREDVRRFVVLEGLPIVEDPANTDPASPRARTRHEALPALIRLGPDPVAALCRLADLAADDAAALEAWAISAGGDVRHVGPVVSIARRVLDGLPPAVARRVLRALVAEVGRRPPPSAAAVARILALEGGRAVDLPGQVRASAAAGWVTVAPAVLPTQEPTRLVAGATTAWAPAGLAVAWHRPGDAAPTTAPGQLPLELAGAWTPPDVDLDAPLPPGAWAARGSLALPIGLEGLWLRHRRPGDRVRLAAGRRRLKDVLVDAGLPRPVRGLWPVVADADDRLVWVPGVAVDEEVLGAGRRRPAGLLALTRLRGGGAQ